MNCDEHFGYVEASDHCVLVEYLDKKQLSETTVEIPEAFNGKPVAVIGENAFKDAVYPERLILPDSVEEIGAYAFEGCMSLREIVWGKGPAQIGLSAFAWCTALERLVLPDGLVFIDGWAFADCVSLREVVLPRVYSHLWENAFSGCESLESVVFPGAVTIHEFAFSGCPKLPPEILMYSMTGTNSIDKPFHWSYDKNDPDFAFDWGTALRGDVFALAVEHGCFRRVNKEELFRKLLAGNLMDKYLPYMKTNGWIYAEEQSDGLAAALCRLLANDRRGEAVKTLERADWFAELFEPLSDALFGAVSELGSVELTAWLLEYKRRRFGFDGGDKYEI
ncbi:MAG: leucine-rich repeat domain-containing protein [Ruminococcus sp.]|nr:leucine-rich repeat domain-containing protein [Ruminococcus sp.]